MVDINEELKEKIQATHDTVEGLRDELQKPCTDTSMYSNQTISVAMVKEDLRDFKQTVGHLYQFVCMRNASGHYHILYCGLCKTVKALTNIPLF